MARTFGWAGLIAVLALFGAAVFLFWSGDRSWLLGVVATFPVLTVVAVLFLWWGHLANTLDRFRRLKTPEAAYVLAQDSLTVHAEGGSGTLPWAAIIEVWEFPDYWLLFTAPNQFTTLPIAGVPPEALDFIRHKVAPSAAR